MTQRARNARPGVAARRAIAVLIAASAISLTRARPLAQAGAAPRAPIASAAGLTRSDKPLVTIENPDPFAGTAAHRLVVVGAPEGGEDAARGVSELVSWFTSRTPQSIREQWTVSAMPSPDPDGRSRQQPFAFPPEKGYFDDAQQPESRYVWRWITFQAPDVVVVLSDGESASAASLSAALATDRAAGLGSVQVVTMKPADAASRLPEVLARNAARSPLHAAIARRVARDPLEIARVLAARYPETPAVSYIPSVAWVNTLRLATITGDERLRAKVRQQVAPWLSGEKKLFGDQIQMTSVAGTMIYAELAREGDAVARALADDGARRAADRQSGGIASYARGWTDDMFMTASVLARTGALFQRTGDFDSSARLLIDYAARLQRPDGIFIHVAEGPFAWGRGNGFAALGLTEILTAIPATHDARGRLLDIYRRHMAALRTMQAPDGMWREVVDEPGSYREETATAMILSAMARGIRLGWLERSDTPIVERAWRALAAHIAEDGALVDVCSSTAGGSTKRYYLDRPAISGGDDRGGAMALLAAVEMYELGHGR